MFHQNTSEWISGKTSVISHQKELFSLYKQRYSRLKYPFHLCCLLPKFTHCCFLKTLLPIAGSTSSPFTAEKQAEQPTPRKDAGLFVSNHAVMGHCLMLAGGLHLATGCRLRELWCFCLKSATWHIITKVRHKQRSNTTSTVRTSILVSSPRKKQF